MTGRQEVDEQLSREALLGIVVVNYGSHALLEQNLLHLNQSDVSTQIVIVDNFHSVEESHSVRAAALRHGWALVSNPRNLGFGSAMNQGVERARALGCTVFLLLNPDVRIQASAIQTLYRHCIQHPLALVSPSLLRPDGSAWFAGGTVLVGRGQTSTAPGSDSSAPNGWLTGACLAIHEELWRAVGGFDEDYFLYWEDIDLSWRCVAAGGELVVLQNAEAVHSVGGTQTGSRARGGKSAAYMYYNCRNRLLFAGKHLTRHEVVRWLARNPAYAYRVLLRGGRRPFVRNAAPLLSAAARGCLIGSIVGIRRLIRQ